LRYILRRLVGLAVALALVSTSTFFMIHLVPGDPVRGTLGLTATHELVVQRTHDLGLDQSIPHQYWHFTTGLFHGQLGTSITSQEPVSQIIGSRLPKSAELAVGALLLTLVLAIPLGLFAGAATAYGRRKNLETVFNGGTGLVAAVPEYLMAVLLAYLLAVKTHLLPVAGAGDGWRSYVLPIICIAIGPLAVLSRLVRVQTLNVLTQDYVRTARSKRLPARVVYLRHALPNLLTAAMTIGGLLFASLIGGSVIVENVFAWPGLGSEVVQSIQSHDYPVIQGIVLVLASAVVIINAIVDILLVVVDPRSAITGEQ
jgi:peptide/nickel transport system permease protein